MMFLCLGTLIECLLTDCDKVLTLLCSEVLQTEIRVLYKLLYIVNNSFRQHKPFRAIKQVGTQCFSLHFICVLLHIYFNTRSNLFAVYKLLFASSAGWAMHKPLERDEVTSCHRRSEGTVSKQTSEVRCRSNKGHTIFPYYCFNTFFSV